MNKVLIITYYWPPSGGAGVQRWLKFTKYLPAYGWEPVVLTVDPDYAAYPAFDHSLARDIDPSLRVVVTSAADYFRIFRKNKSGIPAAGFANSSSGTFKDKFIRFIRGNFFIPDPRKGWNKKAISAACRLIKEEGIKNVITTSPPHSSQLIGLKLKKMFPGINWIADLRDPWTDIYYAGHFYPTAPARALNLRYEKKVLAHADRIITVGKSLKDLFMGKVHGIGDKMEIITNGFDESDFPQQKNIIPERITISYIGTLSNDYPLSEFIDAAEIIAAENPSLALRFVGTISPEQKNMILSRTKRLNVEFIPTVEHQEAIRYLLSSSMLLLVIPDHLSSKGIITGKIFEYIAASKPVVCLGPVDGDAAVILNESGHGQCFAYNDKEGIIDFIRKQIAAGFAIREECNTLQYSRRELAGKVAGLLRP